MREGEIARDAPAHRQAHEVDLFCFQEIDHPQHVGAEIIELQRPVVIVRVAVAARVPGNRLIGRRERRELRVPMAPIAADAVQEQEQGSAAGDAQRDARRTGDQDGFQGYSAFAPEIFTARARLSLSLRM
jgi:hypothetical protein